MAMDFESADVLEHVDLNNLVNAMNGNGVYAYPDSTSFEVTEKSSPDMGVTIKAGRGFIDDVKLNSAAPADRTIEASHATLNRKDLITYAAASPYMYVTKGTDHAGGDADPIYPPDIPANHILLAIVDVDAAATTINTADIHDKRIMITGTVYDLAPGGALLGSDTAEENITTSGYLLYKTISIPTDIRANSIELSFSWTMKGVATGTVYGRIYRYGSPVGTEKNISGSVHTSVSDIVDGWSPGDTIQLYCKRGTSTDGWVASFKVSGAYVKLW